LAPLKRKKSIKKGGKRQKEVGGKKKERGKTVGLMGKKRNSRSNCFIATPKIDRH